MLVFGTRPEAIKVALKLLGERLHIFQRQTNHFNLIVR